MKIVTPEFILRVVGFLLFLAIWNLGLPLSLSVMITAVPFATVYLILFYSGVLKKPLLEN